MAKIRIAGAIAGKHGVTLYHEDGRTEELRADGYQTAKVLEAVQPFLARSKIAEIDLDDFLPEKQIEKQTGGKIRFLKLVGDAVKSLFTRQGINENVAHEFKVQVPAETTVAVINGVEVPGMEKIAKQIDYAAATGNVEGLKRFMERLAAVAEKRAHTAQELLQFIERGDLPIADDGSIVAYKRLYRRDDHFVDPHTKKVRQKVGTLVKMDESEVDKSRRTECSTGLHIGRRDYMPNFNGDAIMITKVAPEDVIAVPHGQPSKMRTAAYHIVAEVNKAGFNLLCSNQPMTRDPESAKLLANVIKGNHVGVLEIMLVGKDGETKEPVVVAEKPEPLVLKEIHAITVDEVEAKTISPRELNKRTDEIIREAAASGDMSAAISDVPVPAKKVKQAKPKVAEKPAPTAPAVKIDATETEKRDAEVLELIKAGKAQREVERITGVSGRTIRRILDKHGLRGQ